MMDTLFAIPKMAPKDVFNSFLVTNATYDGEDEIPVIKTSNFIHEKVISFSNAKSKQDYDAWVHFYQCDSKIECFWRSPQKYLPMLKRYKGVISPDYSLYYDMPLCMQKYNTYRGKALAHWLIENGVEVISNVRWGDERTFDTACLGVEPNKTIAVGTHGCIKTVEGKRMFIAGFDYVVNFCLARMYGIELIPFESEFGLTHKKGVS